MASVGRKVAVSEKGAEAAQAYWRANLRLILSLLAIWALVSYGFLLLAQPFANVMFGNVPFSFWMAQQGAIIIFVILIFVYARIMDNIDRKFDVHE